MRTPKKSRNNRDQLPLNNPMARAINSAVASITGGSEGLDALILAEDEESSSGKKRKLSDAVNVYGTVFGGFSFYHTPSH